MNNRVAVLGFQEILVRRHQFLRFPLRFFGERNVNGHLVSIKVGIKSLTNQRMHLNRVSFNQDRMKSLNSQPVQSRSAIQKHVLAFDHLFKHRPDLRRAFLNQLVGAANVKSELRLQNPGYDKGSEKLEDHMLRQTALIELELRTDYDH